MGTYFRVITDKLKRLPLLQRRLLSLALLLLLVFLIVMLSTRGAHNPELSSSVLGNNGAIPKKYTCDAENISPPFTITNVSGKAKSLALLFVDTSEEPKVLWTAWNIPSTTEEILEGIRPPGTVARSFSGNFGYSGPCPDGTEPATYKVHLYALKSEQLSINSGASYADFLKAVEKDMIGEGVLTVTYQRGGQ